jgi:hypothetical protein
MDDFKNTIWWNEMPYVVLDDIQTTKLNKHSSNQSCFAVLIQSTENTVYQYENELYVYWDGHSNGFEFLHISEKFTYDDDMNNINFVYFSDAFDYLYDFLRKNKSHIISENYAVNGLELAFQLTFTSQPDDCISMIGNFVSIPLARESPGSF